MKEVDKVKMTPMWKYDEAVGEIIKITRDGYVVIKWQGINGEWHYTEEQTKNIQNLSIKEQIENEEAMWITWGDR